MTDCGGATEEAYLGQGVARSHGRQSESETYDLRHHGGFGWVVGVGVLWVEDIFIKSVACQKNCATQNCVAAPIAVLRPVIWVHIPS